MKKLSFMIVVVSLIATSALTIIACNKNNASKSTGKQVETQGSVLQKTTSQYMFGDLQLRRNRGKKKKGVDLGKACNCNYCFGICSNGEAEEFEPQSFVNSNVIIEDLGDGTAYFYVLEQPDIDVTADPTLYVDDNVLCDFNGTLKTIIASTYPFSTSGGVITIGSQSYTYYGSTIVTITP
jgi:hypothetical protein